MDKRLLASQRVSIEWEERVSLSSEVHLEVGERGRKEPSHETTRTWLERWEGGRESRGKGVWPVVVKVTAKSGQPGGRTEPSSPVRFFSGPQGVVGVETVGQQGKEWKGPSP